MNTPKIPPLISPLIGAWEFLPRPRPLQEAAEWRQLGKLFTRHHWHLEPALEQRFRANREAMVVTTPDRVICFVNQLVSRMTGYAPAEMMGKTPALLQSPTTDPAARLRIRTALQEGQSVQEQLFNIRKDGSPYWCSIEIHPIQNPTGKLVHFVAFEQEISAPGIV